MYDKLVERYVHLGTPETRKSKEELIRKFKDCLVPIEPKKEECIGSKISDESQMTIRNPKNS